MVDAASSDDGRDRGLLENRELAAALHEVADLLEQQGASSFRVRAYLADRLGARYRAVPRSGPGPPVELLLEVDRRYRQAAEHERLPRIAPRRFNPEGRAWLPIGHFEIGGWQFTALFSNTARAHQLGKTRDWVVIFFYDGNHREGQHTVVTEWQGPLTGLRVVRGREAECRAYYDRAVAASSQSG